MGRCRDVAQVSDGAMGGVTGQNGTARSRLTSFRTLEGFQYHCPGYAPAVTGQVVANMPALDGYEHGIVTLPGP